MQCLRWRLRCSKRASITRSGTETLDVSTGNVSTHRILNSVIGTTGILFGIPGRFFWKGRHGSPSGSRQTLRRRCSGVRLRRQRFRTGEHGRRLHVRPLKSKVNADSELSASANSKNQPLMAPHPGVDSLPRTSDRVLRSVQRKSRERRFLLYILGLSAVTLLGLLFWPPESRGAEQSENSRGPRRYGLAVRAPRPSTVGHGTVSRCRPNAQNCVSSRDMPNTSCFEPPWRYPSTMGALQALQRVYEAVQRYPGPETSKIIAYKSGKYLYAEFQTRFWGFVDDVECLVDDATHVIHFRSASRIGRSDMGTNRARMRKLFDMLAQEGFTEAAQVVTNAHSKRS
jgi:uncharacterized protein (DUF1499 family)